MELSPNGTRKLAGIRSKSVSVAFVESSTDHSNRSLRPVAMAWMEYLQERLEKLDGDEKHIPLGQPLAETEFTTKTL